ncbi:MAG: NERD domain-containing protein, partial [Acholeplasma sp.]|nr:NERD domain-containing protein [Acholeplasma sp.]
MAIMIPQLPREYNKASLEGYIFDNLSKLSDEYFIFHSFKILDLSSGIRDVEIDFMILSTKGDLIVIEAKAGQIKVIDGDWYYSSGLLMKSGGPFEQAKRNKYALKDQLTTRRDLINILPKLTLIHAICLPSTTEGYIKNLALPMDCPIDLIITKDDLESNIQKKIERIVDFSVNRKNQFINSSEIKKLVYSVLAPTFNVISIDSLEKDIKSARFKALTEEQFVVLDFLENQRSATISGAAGTGKTMIAIEKAKRLSYNNEKVLFLCYNRFLRDTLYTNYHSNLIDYYTLDMFTSKVSNKTSDTFQKFNQYLSKCFDENNGFDYKHVIIDEGQDFGQNDIDEYQIVELLSLIVEQKKGSFYVFYDRYQQVQGHMLPSYIQNA